MQLFAMSRVSLFLLVFMFSGGAFVSAQEPIKKFDQEDKFRQLEEILPTPNDYRSASGAPGHRYWQQKIDYVIDVEIDDDKQLLIGSEEITYTNKSPDPLRYVWLQLDPNIRQPHSDRAVTETMGDTDRMSLDGVRGMMYRKKWDGGIKISKVIDAKTQDKLKFSIVKTMMRIDLP